MPTHEPKKHLISLAKAQVPHVKILPVSNSLHDLLDKPVPQTEWHRALTGMKREDMIFAAARVLIPPDPIPVPCMERSHGRILKRTLLVLVADYLHKNGYEDLAESMLAEEARGYQVCDNIDLERILIDYEAFYTQKFRKLPQLIKAVEAHDSNGLKCKQHLQPRPVTKRGKNKKEEVESRKMPDPDFLLLAHNPQHSLVRAEQEPDSSDKDALEHDYFSLEECGVGGMEVIGLEKGKQVIREAISLSPSQLEFLATAGIRPWRTLLLFGPPGTGHLPFQYFFCNSEVFDLLLFTLF
ncbi:unnamed protein product [Darwinula stevensoni]|uniref:LisH domain-containing protein n=1 Tax=Darwinula stevensoni TaxID=69355 RepID=A0A7R9ACU3_9CRUS|nr:unnamed protein product [Darwinula stevensoni]CAG0900149.1 unnamed protein product [Darwinula stevensoni]